MRYERNRLQIRGVPHAAAGRDMTRLRSFGLSPGLSKFGDLAFPGVVLSVVFVALVCGGATRHGLWSDALVRIVSLPLLAVASFRLRALASPSRLRLPLFLIFAVVLVPV